MLPTFILLRNAGAGRSGGGNKWTNPQDEKRTKRKQHSLFSKVMCYEVLTRVIHIRP